MPQNLGGLVKSTNPVILCKLQGKDFRIGSGYNELPLEFLVCFFKPSHVFRLFTCFVMALLRHNSHTL